MENQQTLIIGANSEIAKALSEKIQKDTTILLTLISRQPISVDNNTIIEPKNTYQKVIVENYDALAINNAVDTITKYSKLPITRIFVCNGLLHNETIRPERRLEDFCSEAFQTVLNANTLTPILWLKYLLPLLSQHKTPCKIAVLSARVGSIEDNQLGGWYTYRSSKAALNMLLKTASIELARRAKHIKLLSFHPGTTNSPLSKPFQKNVAKDKLFEAEFVANQLLTIINEIEIDGKLSYLDWQGKKIPW